MSRIAIIGHGNVGSHLFEALSPLAETVAVSASSGEPFPEDCGIYIIAVPDDHIRETASRIKRRGSIIVHTSGSTPMPVLGMDGPRGVIYPLQTFTKGVATDMAAVPFFLEASDKETLDKLRKLVSLVSSNIYEADSGTRKKLHIAAVLACNFTCRLWSIADAMMRESGADFQALAPLIKETFRKAQAISPREAQTGPARRHDEGTISSHLELLSNDASLHEIYRLLSDNISENY